MAWYHVGGCDCPMGCCDCGSNDLKPKTQRDLLIEALKKSFQDIDKNRKAVISMQKGLDDEADRIRQEAYKKHDEIIESAKKEADLIIKKAEEKSSETKILLTKVKNLIKKDKLNKKERVYLYRIWDHLNQEEFTEFLRVDCENGIDY